MERTEREIELTSIIAELKVVQERIEKNIDLTDEDKRCIGGPLSDSIADAEFFLQEEMDQRIADQSPRVNWLHSPVTSYAGSV